METVRINILRGKQTVDTEGRPIENGADTGVPVIIVGGSIDNLRRAATVMCTSPGILAINFGNEIMFGYYAPHIVLSDLEKVAKDICRLLEAKS